jgi:CheY-like chemotaxis protein
MGDLSRSVLVIDDEPAMGRCIARSLRNHLVTAVTDGAAALALLASGKRFGTILCDVRMPRMSSEVFYYALVESFPDMAARTVFMSGLLERAHFLLALPQVCLEKPFTAEDLREAIRMNCAPPCAA